MTLNNALHQALLSSFNQYADQLSGKRVWLACSGGRDSLSLALVCWQLFDAGHLPFLPQLLHVNHGMQQANAAWAQQVTTWAQQLSIPCHVLSLQLTEKTEQAARQARYEAMMSVMNTNDVLILGHHQDDQVETVLMRLFNGAGVKGLGGMQEWRYKSATVDTANEVDIAHDAKRELKNTQIRGIYLWRPWLSISRAQITEYAKAQQLEFIDDPTNIMGNFSSSNVDADAQNGNDRAWLRSILLPHMTQRYPQAKSAIARTALLMQDAAAIIDEQTWADMAKIGTEDTAWQSIIDIKKLHALSMPRQSALIHAWLSPSDRELPPSKRLVDEVLQLAKRQNSDHQTSLYWDSGHHQYHIRRYKNQLYRLHHDWLDWLEVPVAKQAISLTDLKQKNQLTIKPNTAKPNTAAINIKWQMQGMTELASVLQEAIADVSLRPELSARSYQLLIEPLPRDLKLSLAGRVGRKSGKKLMQALDQPSFMRQSVALCSLLLSSQSQPPKRIPLFIITTQHIQCLSSGLEESVVLLNRQEILTTQVTTDE